jgi:hypothetical protein
MMCICMIESKSRCFERLRNGSTSNQPLEHEAFLMTLKKKAAMISLLLATGVGLVAGAPNDDVLKALPSPGAPGLARPTASPVGTPAPIATATPSPTPSPSPTPTPAF